MANATPRFHDWITWGLTLLIATIGWLVSQGAAHAEPNLLRDLTTDDGEADPVVSMLHDSLSGIWDVEPEPNWTMGAEAFGGLASGGRAFTVEHIMALAPADTEPGPFGLLPIAIETTFMALEGEEPLGRVYVYHPLGISNSFSLVTAYEAGQQDQAKIGAGYYFKRTINPQVFMDDNGGLSARLVFRWDLPGVAEERAAYWVEGDIYYDPGADTGGRVEIGHWVLPDGSQGVKAGVANIGAETFWYAGYEVTTK